MNVDSSTAKTSSEFANAASQFVRRTASIGDVRTSAASYLGFSRKRWNAMAEQGWVAAQVPEEYGGLGLPVEDVAAIHIELGRGAVPEPMLLIGSMIAPLLARCENRTLASSILPSLLDGSLLAGLAWQGSAGAMSSSDLEIAATRDNRGWVLSGRAQFVGLGPVADMFLVAAKADDGVIICCVDRHAIAKPIEAARAADNSVLGAVDFSTVKVNESAVLAGPNAGARLLENALAFGRIFASSELLGAMESVFEMVINYLKQREQFGKPIGSFQALQHRAVDLFIQIELSRAALKRAADTMHGGDANAAAAAACAAKARCSEAGMLLVKQGIQLHGAIGYTEEYPLSVYVRRILFLAALLGSAPANRTRYAELVNLAGKH